MVQTNLKLGMDGNECDIRESLWPTLRGLLHVAPKSSTTIRIMLQ